MPSWIHKRRDHIKKENPNIDDSMAWAIATEQAYATDKAPKGFGSDKARKKSKKKYKKSPSSYEQRADPPKKKKKSKKSFLTDCHLFASILQDRFPQEAQLLHSVTGD